MYTVPTISCIRFFVFFERLCAFLTLTMMISHQADLICSRIDDVHSQMEAELGEKATPFHFDFHIICTFMFIVFGRNPTLQFLNFLFYVSLILSSLAALLKVQVDEMTWSKKSLTRLENSQTRLICLQSNSPRVLGCCGHVAAM